MAKHVVRHTVSLDKAVRLCMHKLLLVFKWNDNITCSVQGDWPQEFQYSSSPLNLISKDHYGDVHKCLDLIGKVSAHGMAT